MIEIEVKLPVYRRSEVERDLRRLGFVPGDLVRESDIYYTSDFHDFIKNDEALRIRTSDNLTRGSFSSFLTFKGPKIDDRSMTRKELETKIEDPDIGREILKSLNYRDVMPVIKLRQYYELTIPEGTDPCLPEGYAVHACVDQVKNLGSFLELEILVNDEAYRPQGLKKIEAILHDLGYSMGDTTRYSYLWMLMSNTDGAQS